MKKLIKFVVGLLVIVLLVAVGYSTFYKSSPRDYITRDTRFIYANEGISGKDFKPFVELFEEGEKKEDLERSLKYLKFLSKAYIFSEEEFEDMSTRNFVAVVDMGYWYPLALREIDTYFDRINDIYVLKEEHKKKIQSDFDEDIYMINKKGLFFLASGESTLKNFVTKKRDNIYNKKIEETLDAKRVHLFGTVIYSSPAENLLGVDLVSTSSTMKDDKVKNSMEIYLSQEMGNKLKAPENSDELIKYIDKNRIYVALENFENIKGYLLNPYTKQDVDNLRFVGSIMGIDILAMIGEVDKEFLYDMDKETALIKIKENAPEFSKFIGHLNDPESMFYGLGKYDVNTRILTLGKGKIEANTKLVPIDKGTFVYGDIDEEKDFIIDDFEGKIRGQQNMITFYSEVPNEVFKLFLRGY